MALSYRFGGCEVRPAERRLLVDGQATGISSRAFDLLIALLDRRDRIVSKDELLDIVWPDSAVEENNLQVHVSALRRHLGREAIATVPGRGYRFTADLGGSAAASQQALPPRPEAAGAAVDTFIGREADLAALAQHLSHSRLVTILGPGGVGKTRLAREVVRSALLAQAPRDIVWVELANLTARAPVAPLVAAACGVRLLTGDPVEAIAAAIADRPILLVLDNCEHVAEEAAREVAALLARSAGLRVLVTSQVALRLHGEARYSLGPLALPPSDGTTDGAREVASLRLFEQRARAIDRRFRLDAANIAPASDVCRSLDGLPLAIEMAAVWAPLLGPAQLASHLDQRIRLLARTHRDSAARHETLRAALDWSHSLLGEAERKVFRRLAAFRGSFTAALAQRLCADDDVDEWGVLEVLASLVDRSLVQVEAAATPRYRLLETTRLYAVEALSASGETRGVVRRHGEVMAELSATVVRAFREQPDASRIEFLGDYDNLSLAFDNAVAAADAGTAARTGQALARLDTARGLHFPLKRRKEAALSLLPGAEDEVAAALWNCIAFSRHVPAPTPKLLAGREEIAAWRAVGDRASLYEALCRHSELAASAGAGGEAEAVLREAESIEDPAWPATFRLRRAFNAALAAAFGDDPAELVRRTERMEPIAADACSAGSLATAKLFRAEATLNQGDPREAIRLIEAEIPGCRPEMLGHSTGMTLVCQSLLRLARDREAADVVRAALPHALRNGVGAWMLDCSAVLAAHRDDVNAAALLLGCADRCYRDVEEIRRLQDRRCEDEAASVVSKRLGAQLLADLRQEGAAYDHRRALALALRVTEQPVQVS